MAHHGMLRDYRFSNDIDDIRGANLYGSNDEKLGKIDDVIFDHSSGAIQYAVIDSGGWFSSKKFLVPAEGIRPYGKNDDDLAIDMSKEQVESLPRYDEEKFGKGKDWNDKEWNEYDKDYRKLIETTGGVLHREDSTHIITPSPDEMPASGDALPGEEALNPDRVAGKFPDPAPNPSKIRLRPSGLAAKAEDSAAPGQFAGLDIPTQAEEDSLDRQVGGGQNQNWQNQGYERKAPGSVSSNIGGVGAVGSTSSTSSLEPMNAGPTSGSSTSDVVDAQRDHLTDPDNVYNSEQTRNRPWAAFEDHLRRNRVDITASCRSCETKEDKVA